MGCKLGRQQVYSNAATQGYLTPKGAFRAAIAVDHGMNGKSFNATQSIVVGTRRRHFKLTIKYIEDGDPYRTKEGPHLLIDSTGIKVEGEGEWQRRTDAGSKPRIWRKSHIAVD